MKQDNNTRSILVTSKYLNTEKLNMLLTVDEDNILIKNSVSEFVFNHISDLYKINSANNFITKYRIELKQFASNKIFAWSYQALCKEVVTYYLNYIEKIKENSNFFTTNGVTITRYKRKTKQHNIGDVKEFHLNVIKPTSLSKLLNYIKYVDFDRIDKLNNKEIVELYNYYCEKFGKERINNLIETHNKNSLRKIHKITFNTGTWTTSHCANGTTIDSDIIIDEINTQYKYWFKLKLNKDNTIYLPLEINKKYHDDINKLKASSWKIKISEKRNKINIISTYETEPLVFKDFNKSIGIDVNVKHNLFTTSEGETIDFDRKWIKKLNNYVSSIDTKNLTDKQKRKLKKLCRQNEWYFKKLISETLDLIEKENVTDVVMEDLDQFSSSFIKSDEFNIKYSALTRLLHLSCIKNWFKQQAEKRGIKVHLTSPCFSSQQCNECGYIDSENRVSQENFICLHCGHSDNADVNAAKNLNSRFMNVSLNQKLHSLDAYGRLISKYGHRQKLKIKQILIDAYNP